MVEYIYQKSTQTFVKLPGYIYQRKNGMFEIRKRIGGALLYWGSFKTLEEAQLYRAFYIGKDWIVNPTVYKDKYIQKQGENKFIIIKCIDGQRTSFGVFNRIEDARNERDICVKCNWDFDLIVEYDERELMEV